MTREELEKRLAELQEKLNQIQANGNAVIGAMQECRYWLAMLERLGEADQQSPAS